MLLDVLSIWTAAVLSLRLSGRMIAGFESPQTHVAFFLLYSALFVLFANTHRLYSVSMLRTVRPMLAGLVRSTAMAGTLLAVSIYLANSQSMPRRVFVLSVGMSFAAMAGWRLLRSRVSWVPNVSAAPWNVLIAGDPDVAAALQRHLAEHSDLGITVTGFLPGEQQQDLESIAKAQFVDEVIICARDRELVTDLTLRASRQGLGVRIVPDFYDGLAWRAPVDFLGDIPNLHVNRKHIPAASLFVKRLLDIAVSALALITLSPLLAALALVVKTEGAGPVFYRSRRVGRKGRIFECYKFRTMVPDAERKKDQLRHLNERDGVLFKISNDPRVTKAGRILRKYSLDELAQLWNVLRGDMSLVGPRPPLASEVRQYQLDHLRRLEVSPGITGLWQVEARTSPSFDRYIELDLQYVRDWNLLLDLRICLKTIAVVFAGTGQ